MKTTDNPMAGVTCAAGLAALLAFLGASPLAHAQDEGFENGTNIRTFTTFSEPAKSGNVEKFVFTGTLQVEGRNAFVTDGGNLVPQEPVEKAGDGDINRVECPNVRVVPDGVPGTPVFGYRSQIKPGDFPPPGAPPGVGSDIGCRLLDRSAAKPPIHDEDPPDLVPSEYWSSHEHSGGQPLGPGDVFWAFTPRVFIENFHPRMGEPRPDGGVFGDEYSGISRLEVGWKHFVHGTRAHEEEKHINYVGEDIVWPRASIVRFPKITTNVKMKSNGAVTTFELLNQMSGYFFWF